MATVLGDAQEDSRDLVDDRGAGRPDQRQVLLGSGSLVLAAIEAICVFFVSANGLIVLVGGATIGLAQGAAFIHAAAIRLPILAVATLGALLNLWLLFNAWNLRRAGSAMWRIKPLTLKEQRRIILIAAMSIVTLLVASELYLHYKEHGSAFAFRSTAPGLVEPVHFSS